MFKRLTAWLIIVGLIISVPLVVAEDEEVCEECEREECVCEDEEFCDECDSEEDEDEEDEDEDEEEDKDFEEMEEEVFEFLEEHIPDLADRVGELREEEEEEYEEQIEELYFMIEEYHEGLEHHPDAARAWLDFLKQEVKIDSMVIAFREEENEVTKKKMKSELKVELDKAFELQMKSREADLEILWEEVKEIKALIEKRRKNKQKIIDRHFKNLVDDRDEDDDLEW